ncbi:5-methyltetrahydrofolate corrinoid/iron sulfur protein methyltransferase [Candidatus Hakubella thermalkaliphila]|uniref:5-methyltetrahydrofolate corrinoid/iron sulfur protein methyltransferase n=4 Tax=Candidatus Hakubella thermalkaliphila TaxID=2754717 RepID=A0A6V8QCL8_9ACTN|nr:dihydropteroate synthase [Candidatus Hakubella thermalkaliphila]GFP19216.1 5-methyltetrahydrofolate corrinoid/iron sulfur protein methyltransferase [Candidatus Hakubella thermalkaliphila]GFP31128.1 5-methyltetrahydrofolate corrinoid/iron sulfur protein methyltransferase [Candidatus Hakubella thermalkaliphila]GFP41784.1 5-methyltetrahydrofolate corrinoid/iron sulfur protein methyltransferase [Candidatus Hakubella thermalkaliphila]
MILIGENIQILSKVVSEALSGRNASPLQELAKEQVKAGVHWIDLNIGPARKNPAEVMSWLVNNIQEVVDLPLALDTTNTVAMEAGLAICRQKPLINSASGTQESKEKMLPLAQKYGSNVVISVLNDAGIPSDAASRAESIMETIDYANSMGIPNEDIWVDPIMMPIGVSQSDVLEVIEFVGMLPSIAPGVKSTIGLSNLSNGVPRDLRHIINQVALVILGKAGLYSAIVDSFDKELVALNAGKEKEIIDIILKVMDGEDLDMAAMSQVARNYYKTARVIMGRELYSPSWLEI